MLSPSHPTRSLPGAWLLVFFERVQHDSTRPNADICTGLVRLSRVRCLLSRRAPPPFPSRRERAVPGQTRVQWDGF